MARQLRIQYPGALYHVTCRGNERQDIYRDKEAYEIFKDRGAICRRGKNTMLRSMSMEFLYRYCNITQSEIGRLLGGIDYSAVSVSRKRLRKKIENDTQIKGGV